MADSFLGRPLARRENRIWGGLIDHRALEAALSTDSRKCGDSLSTQDAGGVWGLVTKTNRTVFLTVCVMGRRVGEGDRVSGTALGAFTGSIMVPISASERFSNLPTSHCLSVAEPGLTARPSSSTV